MLENLSGEKFIEAVSSTLNCIIVPYEEVTPLKHLARIEFEKRRGEFGCLRKTGDWPLQFGDSEFWWSLIYEGRFGTGNSIYFRYNRNTKTFSVSGSKLDNHRDFTTQDSGEAFERLERRIEQIPLEQ